mgnify:CR=1 FL=1
MKSNVGNIDRVLRLVLGVVLLLAPFVSGIAAVQSGAGMVISMIVGGVMIATAGMRFCLLYRIVGINTCKL